MACTPRPLRFLLLQGVVVRSGGIAWARRGLNAGSTRAPHAPKPITPRYREQAFAAKMPLPHLRATEMQ